MSTDLEVPVYFCTVVHNRWKNLTRLMQSFGRQQYSNAYLCIYDWNSSDHGPINTRDAFYNEADNPPKANYKYVFEPNSANFGVTIGKNKAFDIAQPSANDIVFFIDCDVVIPVDMAARIAKTVRPGTAYFPVFYSLYKGRPAVINGEGPQHHPGDSRANGWWRKTSSGNCGFTASDFISIGKWDERFGDKYGRDDDDLHWRAAQKLEIVRDNVDGFFHFWHPVSTAGRNPRLREIPWHPLYEGDKSA